MRHDVDVIYRRGEDPLCGIQILGAYGQDESHEAMHRRSEVVANAAIESSRRGDGRFLEGPGAVAVTLERGATTLHGTLARAVRAARDFEHTLARVQRVVSRSHPMYDCGGTGHGPDVSEVRWCHDCNPQCCSGD